MVCTWHKQVHYDYCHVHSFWHRGADNSIHWFWLCKGFRLFGFFLSEKSITMSHLSVLWKVKQENHCFPCNSSKGKLKFTNVKNPCPNLLTTFSTPSSTYPVQNAVQRTQCLFLQLKLKLFCSHYMMQIASAENHWSTTPQTTRKGLLPLQCFNRNQRL